MKRSVRLISAAVLTLASTTAWAQVTVTVTYYHTDHLGSPSVGTDASGNVVFQETYAPYGKRTKNQPGINGHTFGYSGHALDSASGLTYMGARFYDAKLGRFHGIDPEAFTDRNVQSFNRYAYANDNPERYTDPTGRSPEELERIRGAFDRIVRQMGEDGDRLKIGGGVVNNLTGAVLFLPWAFGAPVTPPSGCQGQAIILSTKLKHDPAYNKEFKNWTFEPVTNYPQDTSAARKYLPFSGYHWVVKATSKETGEVYMLDPNNNQFSPWKNEEHDQFQYSY